MKNTKATAHHFKQLVGDLRALAEEAGSLVGDAAGEHSEEAVKVLESKFSIAQERFADLYGQTKKKAMVVARQTDEAVRSNPYQTVLIGAGVGLLVGWWIGRSSDDG